ncbi:hypothetical protein AQ712_19825 [Burkholderia pseudomallei]|nr:hypothetical protein AQ712_19825 [Burkholderia pseudomallei]
MRPRGRTPAARAARRRVRRARASVECRRTIDAHATIVRRARRFRRLRLAPALNFGGESQSL